MRIFALLAALLAASTAFATEWLTDYQEAIALSQKTGKPILMDFTGSDWCRWCVVLDKEVFSKKEFETWADSHVILLELDFPQEKETTQALRDQNMALAQKYAVESFPTILVVDSSGTVLAKTGYRWGGAKAYVDHLNKLLQ